MAEIVQKELSYKIVGILFEVHRELGGQYQEKYYQRAVAKALQENDFSFQEQTPVDLRFRDEKIGKYFVDFVIEGKVVLELKAEPIIKISDVRQVLAYLKSTGLELGIVANFRGPKLLYKRVLNSDCLNIRDNSEINSY